MNTIEIRPMRVEDLPMVSALGVRSKASWGYTEEQMRVFQKELTFGEADFQEWTRARVATLGGSLVGYYALRADDAPSLELDFLFVDPNAFGQGVGRALLDDARREAREMGFAAMRLIADPHSVGFYERFGATTIGMHVSSIPNRSIPILTMPTRFVPSTSIHE